MSRSIHTDYLIMCELATEIQVYRSLTKKDYKKGYRIWEAGDFYWSPILGTIYVVGTTEKQPDPKINPIWLPSIEQLHDLSPLLSKNTSSNMIMLHKDFIEFLENIKKKYPLFREEKYKYHGDISWLSYVMMRKFFKVWNNNKWVKIG